MKKSVSRKKKMICNLLTCALFSVSFFTAAAAGMEYVSCAEESSSDDGASDEVTDSEVPGTVGESVLSEEKITTIVWAVSESNTTMFYGSGVKSWYKKLV